MIHLALIYYHHKIYLFANRLNDYKDITCLTLHVHDANFKTYFNIALLF